MAILRLLKAQEIISFFILLTNISPPPTLSWNTSYKTKQNLKKKMFPVANELKNTGNEAYAEVI